ncbi:hypothetical protein TCAL_17313 [Tigriopus californicus]|uniref:Uncharacterized protein n=1 Tax=Tigriopus californicus TaxID=6832 RepID=A0A553NYA7_TIGCA|nr:hypothetical protein TCAL_17313 [Tigriopus californicus]
MSQPSVPAAVPKEVMDAFWKLGDTKDPIRLAAAQKIVAHAQSLKLSAAQPVDQRQDYVLGRLVKGLGSHSRRGFYVALHEILKNTGSEGVARVKQLMKQHLAVKGSKSDPALCCNSGNPVLHWTQKQPWEPTFSVTE